MNLKKLAVIKSRQALRFIRFVYHHFIEDDCTYRASALAFTSLLAVVPLMSVSLAVLSAFPVFHDLAGPVQDFIFVNFVPTTGQIVQQYLQQFTAQVSRLSIVGVVFLFVTALLVMVTIEGSMNKIWRVSTSRRGISAFLLYWAILSLAPILLGLSLAATSYLVSMPLIRDHQPSVLMSLVPFLLSLIAFTFLFVVVPNCKVKIRHGLWGASVAAILFEAAKLAFAYYLSQYNTYELVYGAFATVPIFFIWVYWVWVITLLGAEITYALSVHYQRRAGVPLDGFSHALLWLNELWKAQQQGKSMRFIELVNANTQPFEVRADEMIKLLNEKKLIHATQNDNIILSRDLSQLSLYELTQLLPYSLPSKENLKHIRSPHAEHWVSILSKNDDHMKKLLSINMSQLFSQSRDDEATES